MPRPAPCSPRRGPHVSKYLRKTQLSRRNDADRPEQVSGSGGGSARGRRDREKGDTKPMLRRFIKRHNNVMGFHNARERQGMSAKVTLWRPLRLGFVIMKCCFFHAFVQWHTITMAYAWCVYVRSVSPPPSVYTHTHI